MTQLLEQAFARVRTLPPERQDEIARIVLALVDEFQSGPPTDERFRAICVKHVALADARDGAKDRKV